MWPSAHESSMLAHEPNCILLFILPKCDIMNTVSEVSVESCLSN
jgi:hypothetical protein